MPVGIAFRKYEGLGNDFIVADVSGEADLPARSAAALCDRRRGVGADGVLLVLPPRQTGCDVRMRVVNADGSVPEMCGNGARCVALHVARARGLRRAVVRIDTDAGVRACDVDDAEGKEGNEGSGGSAPGGSAVVTVDMGIVRVAGELSLDLGGERLVVTVADAGNPHAVAFGDFSREEAERLGGRAAVAPAFPCGTNVEFARVTSRGIDLVVWERGVGITLACGTGACAAAAVACARGLVERGIPIGVDLPGGRLEVTIDREGRTAMRGPARHVFSGTIVPP